MNTRSLMSSQVCWLSFSSDESDGTLPASPNCTRRGPMAPMFRYTDEAPGPQLKEGDGTFVIGARHDVGSVDHFTDQLALGVAHLDRADGGVVIEDLAVQRNRLMHRFVFRQRRQVEVGLVLRFRVRLGRCGGRRWLGVGGIDGAGQGASQQAGEGQSSGDTGK